MGGYHAVDFGWELVILLSCLMGNRRPVLHFKEFTLTTRTSTWPLRTVIVY
jgi:hypothetical protein